MLLDSHQKHVRMTDYCVIQASGMTIQMVHHILPEDPKLNSSPYFQSIP